MKKFEYNGFVTCGTLKTAYKILLKRIGEMSKECLYDDEFINQMSKGEFSDEGKSNTSDFKYSQYKFREYHKNHDGSFYRIEIEHIDDNQWYIDIGFTI